MLNWLREFFSQCRHRLPKVWRRADIIAVVKPNKSADDAKTKNYRPIALLCVPLKLLERLLLSRLDSVIDPQLPPEQAGFRHGRSTTDHVTLLTEDNETGFEHNRTLGVALLDITAAYDTVWLRGLHQKLQRMLRERHVVSFVMELLTNRSFHNQNGAPLPNNNNPVYFGVTLDRSLTYTNILKASRACGHITHSVQHVVVDCTIHTAPGGFAGLRRPDAATMS